MRMYLQVDDQPALEQVRHQLLRLDRLQHGFCRGAGAARRARGAWLARGRLRGRAPSPSRVLRRGAREAPLASVAQRCVPVRAAARRRCSGGAAAVLRRCCGAARTELRLEATALKRLSRADRCPCSTAATSSSLFMASSSACISALAGLLSTYRSISRRSPSPLLPSLIPFRPAAVLPMSWLGSRCGLGLGSWLATRLD